MTRSKGFTLAELAVAIVILALLLFGAMVPFSAQMEIRNTAETRRTMDTIMDAIVGFAIANGRLPCPADGSVPAGSVTAGTEQVTGNTCAALNSPTCTAINGGLPCPVLPWATLGVPETDGWGRRFSYRVSPVFADQFAQGTWATSNIPPTTPTSPGNQPACAPSPTPLAPTSFALCTLGDIAVFTRSASAAVPSGSALPLVVISHGKNGRGAWQVNGTRLAAAPAGTDEAANANGNVNAPIASGVAFTQRAFFSRNPAPAASGCSDPAPGAAGTASPVCEFDDLVVTISSSTLIARMVAAGRLP